MKNVMTDNIFEDIGFNKQEAANLKVRAILLIEIKEYIRKKRLKQKEAAVLLGINQPEVRALMDGHIFNFRIDALVKMLIRVGWELKTEFICQNLVGKIVGLEWINHIIYNKNNRLSTQSYSPFRAEFTSLSLSKRFDYPIIISLYEPPAGIMG